MDYFNKKFTFDVSIIPIGNTIVKIVENFVFKKNKKKL